MRKFSPAVIGTLLLTIFAVILLLMVAVEQNQPQAVNPAYAAAIEFVNAAGSGDDAAAEALMSDELSAYVAETCPQGSVAACIDAYSPEIWGDFINGVFRRAQPDGPAAWDILLLGTWAEDEGFSGVCIYTRAEQAGPENWEIVAWSGWIPCNEPNAGLSSLMQSDAPNRAP